MSHDGEWQEVGYDTEALTRVALLVSKWLLSVFI